MASARAANFQSISSATAASIYASDSSSHALGFRIECHDHDASNAAISSPSPILVSIQPLHADTEFVAVMPGTFKEWARIGDDANSITNVSVKTPSVTGAVAVISFDVSVAKA